MAAVTHLSMWRVVSALQIPTDLTPPCDVMIYDYMA